MNWMLSCNKWSYWYIYSYSFLICWRIILLCRPNNSSMCLGNVRPTPQPGKKKRIINHISHSSVLYLGELMENQNNINLNSRQCCFFSWYVQMLVVWSCHDKSLLIKFPETQNPLSGSFTLEGFHAWSSFHDLKCPHKLQLLHLPSIRKKI